MRRSIESREKDLSRELHALNRLPSIATIACVVPKATADRPLDCCAH
jgi:hypothetical protein